MVKPSPLPFCPPGKGFLHRTFLGDPVTRHCCPWFPYHRACYRPADSRPVSPKWWAELSVPSNRSGQNTCELDHISVRTLSFLLTPECGLPQPEPVSECNTTPPWKSLPRSADHKQSYFLANYPITPPTPHTGFSLSWCSLCGNKASWADLWNTFRSLGWRLMVL